MLSSSLSSPTAAHRIKNARFVEPEQACDTVPPRPLCGVRPLYVSLSRLQTRVSILHDETGCVTSLSLRKMTYAEGRRGREKEREGRRSGEARKNGDSLLRNDLQCRIIEFRSSYYVFAVYALIHSRNSY